MTEPDWQALVANAAQARPAPRQALRHDGGITTASRPQKYTCDDNNLYAVKFSQNGHGDGKAIYTEQVVALAGGLIGAPVPTVELVDVAAPLVAVLGGAAALGFEPQPGVHHGSRWVGTNVSDRLGLEQQHLASNRERFGALDVLYAWVPCVGDHQWIYNNEAPSEVYSVDHTSFLPGGPDWNEAGLVAGQGNVALDAQLATLALDANDRAPAVHRLSGVTDEQIAGVVAQPPDEWGVSMAERCALASYLSTRRAAVAAACS